MANTHVEAVEAEVAALREENARLKDNQLDLGVGEWIEQEKLVAECLRLRAHVAALVRELWPLVEREDERHRIWAIIGTVAFERIKQLLDAPDLAALVAREQARDAVVEAAERECAAECLPESRERSHALSNARWDRRRAIAALRAPDAAEGKP